MERNPTIPPNFVTLIQLKERKEKRDEEEARLRKLMEEEERLRKLKKEVEEEEEKLRKLRASVRSNGRKQRRGQNFDAEVKGGGRSEPDPSAAANLQAQVAIPPRSEKKRDEKVKVKEIFTEMPSEEKAAKVSNSRRGANLKAQLARDGRSDPDPSTGGNLEGQVAVPVPRKERKKKNESKKAKEWEKITDLPSEEKPGFRSPIKEQEVKVSKRGANRKAQVARDGRSDADPPTGANVEAQVAVAAQSEKKKTDKKKGEKTTEMPSELKRSEEMVGFGAPTKKKEAKVAVPAKGSYMYRPVRVIGRDWDPIRDTEKEVSVHVNGLEKIAPEIFEEVRISDRVSEIENRVSGLKMSDENPNAKQYPKLNGKEMGYGCGVRPWAKTGNCGGWRGTGLGHRGRPRVSTGNGGDGLVWVKKGVPSTSSGGDI